MDGKELFQAALGLLPPWQVEGCCFDEKASRLDIHLNFPRGSSFKCPVCQGAGKVHDTLEKTWRHLNFFQHETHLHARTPRVDCAQCGVHLAAVPWARPGSGFTLLFEALALVLVQSMPVSAAARVVGEHDTLLWRIATHYVDQARAKEDFSGVCKVGVDETASRRGHKYVSIFVDVVRRKVRFATPGKDAATVAAFASDLKAHGGDPEAVTEASADMSQAFSKGIAESLPNAKVTFDKFHVVKLVNDAVDEVRRMEQKTNPELKKSRYVWLKNPENLTAGQWEKFDGLDVVNSNLKTARAYAIRLSFQELFNQPADLARPYLDQWYYWATHSRLAPLVKVAKTIRLHQDGILRWFTSGINNGILEGVNSLVQAAKAKARGYRSHKNLITMIYLIAGKLDLKVLPT